MSFKDKLEIGLKPDAPYRDENLPDIQKDDPDCRDSAEEGSAPQLEAKRERCTDAAPAKAGGPHAEPEPDQPEPDSGHRRK